MAGMMLMQDGSTHRCLALLGHKIDPIVIMDDQANRVKSISCRNETGEEFVVPCRATHPH